MNRTALVVDDSRSIRRLVGATLQQVGFDVLDAGNGQEALDRLVGRQVELIILDLNMPVMDGLEFLRTLRRDPERRFTPVVFLTTETEASKREEARAIGATGWINKPFHPERILTVVRRLLP